MYVCTRMHVLRVVCMHACAHVRTYVYTGAVYTDMYTKARCIQACIQEVRCIQACIQAVFEQVPSKASAVAAAHASAVQRKNSLPRPAVVDVGAMYTIGDVGIRV